MRRSSLPPPHLSPYGPNAPSRLSPGPESPSHDKEKSEDVDMASAPGMLGQLASGGLFAGATSAASHLINVLASLARSLLHVKLTRPHLTGYRTRRLGQPKG